MMYGFLISNLGQTLKDGVPVPNSMTINTQQIEVVAAATDESQQVNHFANRS